MRVDPEVRGRGRGRRDASTARCHLPCGAVALTASLDTYGPHELTPPRWAALPVGGIGGSISVQPSAHSVATTASCVALSVFTLA